MVTHCLFVPSSTRKHSFFYLKQIAHMCKLPVVMFKMSSSNNPNDDFVT